MGRRSLVGFEGGPTWGKLGRFGISVFAEVGGCRHKFRTDKSHGHEIV